MLIFWTNFHTSQYSLESKQHLVDSQFTKNAELRNEVQEFRLDLVAALMELNETKEEVDRTRKKLQQTEIQLHTYRLQLKKVLLDSDSGGAVAKFLEKVEPLAIDRQANAPADKPWLVVAIPTVPRQGKVDAEQYLDKTLTSYASQIPILSSDPFYSQVRVLVCNNRPNKHEQFNALRNKYKGKSHFVFYEQSIADPDPAAKDAGGRDRPGYKVRQQTRDVVAMLKKAKDMAAHVLIAEDDFVLCPHALRALHYYLDKANRYNPQWIGLRVSYGLSGFLFKSSDVTMLASYLEKHVARRPPDHLVPEFIGRESAEAKSLLGSRKNMAVRWNLLAHIGKWSTLRTAKSPGYPGCYTPLVFPVVFEVDGFKQKECPDDDISPCTNKGSYPSFMVQFGKEMAALDTH